MAKPFMPLPTPSKSDQARQRLLEAGIVVFGNNGLEGATVREIAREAEQNIAAIAYYFGSKESLYRAVLEGIVRQIRERLKDVLDEVTAFQAQSSPSKERALELLISFFRAIYLRILSREDTLPVARLIVRELMQTTTGFEILYVQGFRHLHETLCWLVGIALGVDPNDPRTILRTHTLMGQIYFFVMSRKAILRRVGWKTLEGKNAEQVVDIVTENLRAMMRGFGTITSAQK
jgi:AcrR family transcriptional regulator